MGLCLAKLVIKVIHFNIRRKCISFAWKYSTGNELKFTCCWEQRYYIMWLYHDGKIYDRDYFLQV